MSRFVDVSVRSLAADFGSDRRLRPHSEFSRAQRLGRRVTTPHFVLLVTAQPPRPAHPPKGAIARPSPPSSALASSASPAPRAARLGVVVSRKIGSAVQRNRVKRLCRECFRQERSLVPSGVDLVVIARPGADGLGLGEVRAEWRAAQRWLSKRAAEALARPAGTDHPGNGPL